MIYAFAQKIVSFKRTSPSQSMQIKEIYSYWFFANSCALAMASQFWSAPITEKSRKNKEIFSFISYLFMLTRQVYIGRLFLSFRRQIDALSSTKISIIHSSQRSLSNGWKKHRTHIITHETHSMILKKRAGLILLCTLLSTNAYARNNYGEIN